MYFTYPTYPYSWVGGKGGGNPQLHQQVLQITPTTCANARLTNLGTKNVMVGVWGG